MKNVKVIDVLTLNEVTYDMLEDGVVPRYLESTIDSIKDFNF